MPDGEPALSLRVGRLGVPAGTRASCGRRSSAPLCGGCRVYSSSSAHQSRGPPAKVDIGQVGEDTTAARKRSVSTASRTASTVVPVWSSPSSDRSRGRDLAIGDDTGQRRACGGTASGRVASTTNPAEQNDRRRRRRPGRGCTRRRCRMADFEVATPVARNSPLRVIVESRPVEEPALAERIQQEIGLDQLGASHAERAPNAVRSRSSRKSRRRTRAHELRHAAAGSRRPCHDGLARRAAPSTDRPASSGSRSRIPPARRRRPGRRMRSSDEGDSPAVSHPRTKSNDRNVAVDADPFDERAAGQRCVEEALAVEGEAEGLDQPRAADGHGSACRACRTGGRRR